MWDLFFCFCFFKRSTRANPVDTFWFLSQCKKHLFAEYGRYGVTSVVPCFCSAGCDAAGAFAPWRPQDEAGGGHGSGLCQRDHDPHALPSERDHHLHIQTGTPILYPLPEMHLIPLETEEVLIVLDLFKVSADYSLCFVLLSAHFGLDISATQMSSEVLT